MSVLLVVFAATGVVVTQPAWAISLFEGAFPRVLFHVPTTEKAVALTFDDGPLPDQTRRVLAVLARHQAHATFFMVGGRVNGARDVADEVVKAGHEIGNHSYRHGRLGGASEAAIVDELRLTERSLAPRSVSRLFRPPAAVFDDAQLEVLDRHGYRAVLGSTYPFDTSRPPAAYVEWLLGRNLRPGAIIILHDGVSDPSNMLAGLDRVLAEGRARGYRFVTVSELLALGTTRTTSSPAADAPPSS